MDRRQFVVLGASGLIAALAGCSGTTPTEAPTDTTRPTRSPTSTPADTAEPTATEATDPAQVVAVAPDGTTRFDPESFTVAVGDTVRWVWRSGGHNVVPDGRPSGESWSGTPGGAGETYPGGYAYSHTVKTAGAYEYYCAPHRSIGMTGSFTVE